MICNFSFEILFNFSSVISLITTFRKYLYLFYSNKSYASFQYTEIAMSEFRNTLTFLRDSVNLPISLGFDVCPIYRPSHETYFFRSLICLVFYRKKMPKKKGHNFTNSVFICNILQKKIAATEDGYHDPVPGDQVDGSVKQKHNWFEDDDFNNASDDADLFQTEITVDDDNINLDTMSDTTSFISNPTRIAKPKLAFDDVDKHAKQVMC
jgi:hypothetical protein